MSPPSTSPTSSAELFHYTFATANRQRLIFWHSVSCVCPACLEIDRVLEPGGLGWTWNLLPYPF